MRHFIAISFLLLIGSVASYGQATKASAQKTPDDYLEWFITSGNWQTDPRLYVRTLGTGPDTVILLHGGWGGEHHYLIESTRGLEDNFLFILYDQRGSLRSPCPDATISFDNHVSDLELIRKELGIAKLKIVAHSMGAMLAGGYHDRFPERVKSITLLAPAYLKSPFTNEDNALLASNSQKFQAFMARAEVKNELSKLNLTGERPLSSIEDTYKFRINFGSRFLYDVTKWRSLREGGPFYNPRVDDLVSRTLPSSGWNYYLSFAKSKIPVSVIVGDHDFLDMGGAIIRKWSKDIPTAEVAVIENAGHDIWIDQPAKFRVALEHALKK
jgi:proline iminopeptidase